MKGGLSSLLVALVAATASVQEAAGQLWEAAPAGEEYTSFALFGGVVSPGTTYSDGSTLNSGTALGIRGTYWFLRYFGIGLGATRSKNDADISDISTGFSALGGQDPTVWLWSTHATVRYPLAIGNISWFPYLTGGPTAKTYKWEIYEPLYGGLFGRPYGGSRNTSFGWSYGGGAEVRLGGMFGVTADARRNKSQFDWFGLRSDQSDWILTVGLTIVR